MSIKLKQQFIDIMIPGVAEKQPRKVSVLCMAWEKVGIAIHKGYKTINKTWTVSHMNSGRSILTGIKTQSEAMKYMTELCIIMPYWTFTEEEFNIYRKEHPEESKKVKEQIDTLQKEIVGTL